MDNRRKEIATGLLMLPGFITVVYRLYIYIYIDFYFLFFWSVYDDLYCSAKLIVVSL